MTTIRMLDPTAATGKTKEIFDAVLRRETKVFGATSVSNIWRCMAHSPALLEANWNRSRALMQRGASPRSSGRWWPLPSPSPTPAPTESTLTWPP